MLCLITFFSSRLIMALYCFSRNFYIPGTFMNLFLLSTVSHGILLSGAMLLSWSSVTCFCMRFLSLIIVLTTGLNVFSLLSWTSFFLLSCRSLSSLLLSHCCDLRKSYSVLGAGVPSRGSSRMTAYLALSLLYCMVMVRFGLKVHSSVSLACLSCFTCSYLD